MKLIGIYGTLTFNLNTFEDENSPIRFNEAVPGTVSLKEDRRHDRIVMEMEMDGYVTRLWIGENGAVYVMLGKRTEFDDEGVHSEIEPRN